MQQIESPIGPLFLVGHDDKLCAVLYTLTARYCDAQKREAPILQTTKQQLLEYFQGQRRTFDLPLELNGTTFQLKVWQSLRQIPYGQTKTYKEQALAIESPSAMRAVGRTNGLNPLSIVLPCHRVIGSNGALTGYAGGLPAKAFLLALESRLELSR